MVLRLLITAAEVKNLISRRLKCRGQEIIARKVFLHEAQFLYLQPSSTDWYRPKSSHSAVAW